jgi:hypothetical protein
MPLDRVPGKQSDVLVDHADGLGRASIFRASLLLVARTKSQANN